MPSSRAKPTHGGKIRRCVWARTELSVAYHDHEWGVPLHDDRGLFEFLYVWRFVGGRPKRNAWRMPGQIPGRTPESDALSKDLSGRGFTFVGSTICYAFMQAVGMVNDHVVSCFRSREIS